MDEFRPEPIWLLDDSSGPQDAPPHRSLRCLLVEDSRFDRTLLRYSAERAGVDVTFVDASTLAEARRNLKSRDFDLVILDRGMPDGNGFDLATELTAGTRNAGVPTIAMSGGDTSDKMEEAKVAGCAEFLSKHDLTPEELSSVIGRVMRARPGTQVLTGDAMSSELQLLMSELGETERNIHHQQAVSRLAALVAEIRGRDDGRNAAALEEMADLCMMLWMDIGAGTQAGEIDPALERIA